ncbi:MAG: DUF433 domain-containing protein [Blastocatellia bacterium]
MASSNLLVRWKIFARIVRYRVYNPNMMTELEATITAPLTQWEDGTIRVSGSRVPIDSILHHFKLGAVPEQIVYMFEGLRLADIYSVIAYYLSHREVIEEYLRKQEAREEAVLQRLESDPHFRKEKQEFRERMMARWGTLREERGALIST